MTAARRTKRFSLATIGIRRVPLRSNLDADLVWAWALICALGLVMVATASIALDQGAPLSYIKKQLSFFLVALFACGTILQIPLRFWERTGLLWLFAALLMLGLVLVPMIGKEVNGSARWIPIGPINVQVSEFVKVLLILYFAGFLERRRPTVQASFKGYIFPVVTLLFASLFLMMQPDYGATVVIFLSCFGLLFIAGVRLREFVALALLGVGGLGFLAITSPYRLARLTTFLNPWEDPFNDGFQLTQSLIAIGRGGLWGVGLGESVLKLSYLPEPHTDFIFAVLAEELGLLGMMGLVLLFGFLLYKMLRIGVLAEKQEKWFAAYLIYGIALLFGLGALLNMGVAMGLLPTKGLALPFISYGGSSLVANSLAFGLVLRVNYEVRRSEVQARKVRRR